MDKENLGQKGENFAAEHLVNHSYTILERNYHSRFGEIDIIALKGDTIYFFEVKTRHPYSITQPEESITHQKITRIIKTAKVYISENPHLRTKGWRITLIGIILDGSYSLTFTEIL